MANLTQLKQFEELNGFLLVDKPEGIAFSTVVKAVKRKFNLVKVGHGGSLDAMASGLFILLINDANKFVDRVMGADRVWTASVKWGETTDTGDIHGNSLGKCEVGKIEDFRGDIFQTEPEYCAIRKEGTADYEIVNTGEHSQFMTHIYKLTVEGEKLGVTAAKGLIVRSLVKDMGGVLTALRREKIGRFEVKDAIPFDKLLELEFKDFPSCVMPLSQALL